MYKNSQNLKSSIQSLDRENKELEKSIELQFRNMVGLFNPIKKASQDPNQEVEKLKLLGNEASKSNTTRISYLVTKSLLSRIEVENFIPRKSSLYKIINYLKIK